MSADVTADSVVESLRTRGEASRSREWLDGVPDYVAEYSLTAEHLPALIGLATQWVEDEPDEAAVYGPVHAWRALGQLRAIEAVQPLLDVQDELDARCDEWYLEEFRYVFGLAGPDAIEPLTAYLSDGSHGEFARSSAASGLREIAGRFPETRDQIVALLSAELARHQPDCDNLNALIVGDLLDLDAVEAAEEIERAFAAQVIDPVVVGDWGDVRKQLGVTGLGIAPDRMPGWTFTAQRLGITRLTDRHHSGVAEQQRDRTAKQQRKAKRKRQKKDRKRNRRAR